VSFLVVVLKKLSENIFLEAIDKVFRVLCIEDQRFRADFPSNSVLLS
jgi:hypothetical protein